MSGREPALGRPRESSDLPELVAVEITVLRDRHAGTFPMLTAAIQTAVRWRVIVVLVIATGVVLCRGDGNASPPPLSALARDTGPPWVAAAYGYPLGCLSVTILGTDHTYARADFNHATRCGRYMGYPTVIFRYDSRRWRPALDVIAYTCPVDGLPAEVQAGLGVCQQKSGKRPLQSRSGR